MPIYDPVAFESSSASEPERSLAEAAWQVSQTTQRPVVIAAVSEVDVVARIVAGER